MTAPIVIRPGKWANRLFDAGWSCELQPEQAIFHLKNGKAISVETVVIVNGSIHWHWLFWRTLTVETQHGPYSFTGLSPATLKKLDDAAKASVIDRFDRIKAEVSALYNDYRRLLQGTFYIRAHMANRFLSGRRTAFDNAAACERLIEEATFLNVDTSFSEAIAALSRFRESPLSSLQARNEEFVEYERSLPERKEFLKRAEKNGLTPQQQRSIICHEDRNLLVACAGSGKTSTLAAKAAYSIEKKYVTPNGVLALAFNAEAARQISERLSDRFGIKIDAKTFHSFGRSVIDACGLPARPYAQTDRLLINIVAELRASNPAFNAKWLEFKALYWLDDPEGNDGDYDDLVRAHGAGRGSDKNWTGLPTLKGELVASFQELSIANWLYINGIPYKYEQPYSDHPLPAGWSKYEPDFTYVLADGSRLYHEHFALDSKGNSPFGERYVASVAAKRRLHTQNKTPLIETSSAQIYDGTVFAHLANSLAQHGIQPRPMSLVDLDNELKSKKPDPDLFKLLSAILTHAKESGATPQRLRQNAVFLNNKARARAFLDILDVVWVAYEQRLKQTASIDFADMIRQAADLIDSKTYKPLYKLILVDEFQDISPGRSRLILSLLNAQPDAVLFAVGDDWQAINRFAGSDLSIMRNFEEIYGHTSINKLETTFRSNQGISEAAQKFVSKNPLQIRKIVKSINKKVQATIDIIQYQRLEDQLEVVEKALSDLSEQNLRMGKIATVLLIGRYQYNKVGPFTTDRVLGWKRIYPGVKVLEKEEGKPFSTIHSTKGLEADTVIIHSLQADFYGFPNAMEDDPLLRLIRADKEAFPNAEERRLFYVALTRAKNKAILLSSEDRPSRFVIELIRDDQQAVVTFGGSSKKPSTCPSCKRGFLVLKKNKFGRQFWGCNQYRFIKCDYTETALATNR
ncbi:UvrD-helicase domain-containing protein [Ferrovibrio sp.]|uniref:UvrD-helicase domain-containing protein n=1 Tax=Ferrovibrio sp. TaxID=1917215 RepID=UPI000CCB04E4|nr:UvrD-helicase domain-containing protein [Ferrovibrio sp.]PJI42195.1 MAG: hypothetical protein CTR53_07085 [Ferrovibrio sp.]